MSRRGNMSFGVGATLAVLDIVLAAACFLCLRQNRDLRSQLARAVSAVTPAYGSLAPALIGEDQYGRQRILQFGQDKRPTVIFTFSAKCLYCQAYWKAVKKLQARAPRELRLQYIDTEERPNPVYLRANGAAGEPVITSMAPQAALAYRALVLPQIEVLDGSGRVQWSYAGQITPQAATALLATVDKSTYRR